MTLSETQADQVAALLNARNELTVTYDRDRIMREAADYIFRTSATGEVMAVAQVKKVQWYQFEILHVTVAESYERQGHAKWLLHEAEQKARAGSGRLLQCTIRDGNTTSRSLFEGSGYVKAASFYNERSRNNVCVYQKVLVPAR